MSISTWTLCTLVASVNVCLCTTIGGGGGGGCWVVWLVLIEVMDLLTESTGDGRVVYVYSFSISDCCIIVDEVMLKDGEDEVVGLKWRTIPESPLSSVILFVPTERFR